MSNTSIQLKKSGAAGNTPTGLSFGEVAINYADGKLYYKNALGGTSYISNQFSFDTINANNSLILATGVSDTLSFVAGNNITISTNTTTKTITINSTSSGGGGNDTYARDTANAAFLQANAAYASQNTTGTYANSAFTKANNALANTNGATFGGDLNVAGKLSVVASSGDEGGEIFLARAQSNTTLSGGITIDSYQNKVRFFEQGGSARGAYIDLTECVGGAGTNILNPGATPDSTARATANAAFLQANAAYSSQNTTGSYANSAYTQANTATINAATADSKAVTAGSYANSAYTQANTATNNAAGASLYANGAFIQANAAFTRANSVLGGFRANTLIVANGTGFLSNSNAEFSLSNNTLYVVNATATNTFFANSVTFNDGTKLISASGLIASNAATANVAINARITNVTTGTYFPIVTDTTITGADTFHYSSNDFLMYAANNTFRASGNVWAGQFLAVGTNIPVVNATGHWVGQTVNGVDSLARSTANSAALYANGAFIQANAAFLRANTPDAQYIRSGTSNVFFSGVNGNIIANVSGNTIVTITANGFSTSGANGDISGANNIFGSVINVTTASIVSGINVVPYIQSVFTQANAAFLTANTPQAIANSAALYANAAFIQANAAFAAANSGGGGSGTDNVARQTANAAFIQANAAFAAANAGGGGGGASANLSIYSNFYTANGNTTTFNLNTSPQSKEYTIVNIDGVIQLKNSYSLIGNTVILSENVSPNSSVEITVLGGGGSSEYVNRSYTGDNTTTIFAVTSGVTNNSIIVTENGIVQQPGTDYYVSGSNVIFTAAPSSTISIGIRELATGTSNGSSGSAAVGFVTQNKTVIDSNVTIGAGFSAVSVGPLTIANNVVFSIAAGQKWVIL